MAHGDLNVCDDGLEVWASAPGDGAPRVRFAQDAEIAIPQASNGIAACRVGTSHVAMIRGHHDRAFRVTRSGVITDLGPVVGTNSVGVVPGGDVYWIKSPTKWSVNTGPNEFPVPRDSTGQLIYGQGWTQILNAQPRWTDFYGTKVINGKTLTRCIEIGSWVIGMDTSAPRIVGYLGGVWWLVANTNTQTGPQAVMGLDGRARVAISGTNCRVVSESQFTPLPVPPIVIPTFPKTTQKIGIGLFDDLTGPRIQDYSEVVSPSTRAIFWQAGTAGQTKSKALAKSLNVGAEAYKDGYGLAPSQVPSGFRALVFAYPSKDRTVEVSLGLVDAALEGLTKAGVPCDLAMAMYCQYRQPGDYALPLQKVLDMLAGVWRLGLAYRVGACWGFTKRRMSNGQVVDGVEYWPDIETCYDRLKVASGDWQAFPPYVTSPVTPFWEPLGVLIDG